MQSTLDERMKLARAELTAHSMKRFITLDDPVVPAHHPRMVVETAVAQGADRTALLAGTGLTLAMLLRPETRISYAQFAILVQRALELTNNPALGFDVGCSMRIPQLGVLGLAIMSSPTIGAGLRALVRHYRSLTPVWSIEVRVEGGRGVLRMSETLPLGPLALFATETTLAAFETIGRQLYGAPLPIRSVKVRQPRPAHAARYAELQSAPILFDQPVTEVEFDPAVLDAPNAHADPATAQLADTLCVEQTASTVPLDGLLGEVRRRFDSARGQPPTLEDLAHTLQTSGRSLRRFLRQMGTSYEALLDDSRRQRALDLVCATELTFGEIATQLGFRDVSGFRRAFKRWTGETPHEHRTRAAR